VIDVDVKGFFENISHDIMLQLLGQHTQERWVLLYTERWLKAGVEQGDGSIIARTKGTPQGGVASPLYANIYLHHAFDNWMDEVNPQNPFERYADDICIHCSSKEEAEQLLVKLKERMRQFELELHLEKTKIVYCKNYLRNEDHDNNSFTFLSYSFQPRTIRDRKDRSKRVMVFSAAICQQAKTSIRTKLKSLLRKRWSEKTLEWFADILNPRIRGWMNYYTLYGRYEMYDVFYYLNDRIRKWIANKYKIRASIKVKKKYEAIQVTQPDIFYHWTKGIKA
jgi:group II intron reverse transcriptase/maturase